MKLNINGWTKSFIVIFVVGLLAIIGFNPISEEMVCNSDFKCKIEHKFFGGFSYTRNFVLTNTSTLDITEIRKYHSGRRAGGYTEYSYVPRLDNKKIFILPYTATTFKGWHEEFYPDTDPKLDNNRQQCKNEIEYFYKYKKMPKATYRIESMACEIGYWIFAIFWILFMGVLLLWAIFDKKKEPWGGEKQWK